MDFLTSPTNTPDHKMTIRTSDMCHSLLFVSKTSRDDISCAVGLVCASYHLQKLHPGAACASLLLSLLQLSDTRRSGTHEETVSPLFQKKCPKDKLDVSVRVIGTAKAFGGVFGR